MAKSIRLNRFTAFILLFAAILLVSSLYGCGTSEDKINIYDNNGKIAQEGDSFSFFNRTGETDNKNMDIQYPKFYGVQTIWSLNVEKENEVNIDFDSRVSSGDFKAVIVTPEHEVISFAESSGKGTQKIQAQKGKYSIKIVGRNAKGHIKFDLSAGEGTDVSVND